MVTRKKSEKQAKKVFTLTIRIASARCDANLVTVMALAFADRDAIFVSCWFHRFVAANSFIIITKAV